MGLVARMVAEEVVQRRSTVWTPCPSIDPAAVRTEEAFANYHYGVPFWLRGAEYVRQDDGFGQETFKLVAVRSGGEDDPNNDFFVASPHGEFTMSIQNPKGMGYIKPGEYYRVTVEKFRGPRDSSSG